MALFLDHEVQLPTSASYSHEIVQWHPKSQILAVGSQNEGVGGEVNTFYDEGEHTKNSPLRKQNANITCLSWHPEKTILASGWSNGDACLWNLEERSDPVTVPVTPAAGVVAVDWSSNGSRIVIIDSSGGVLVYKIDHRGHPHTTPFARTIVKEIIKCLLLRPPPAPKAQRAPDTVGLKPVPVPPEIGDSLDMFSRSKTGHESFYVSLGNAESCTFFLGGALGGVYCIRESGTIQETFSVEKPVVKLLYYPEKSVLITVSEDLMLHQHYVAPDCRTEQVLKVKLTEKLQKFCIIWTQPGVLAMSSGESKIRLWDLNNEENCILKLNPTKGYSAGDAVNFLSYSNVKGTLAAGTAQNQVALWRYSKAKDAKELQDCWKLQPGIQLPHPVLSLQWTQTQSLIAVCTAEKVFVLKEQTMLAHMQQKIAAVQSGRSQLIVTQLEKLATSDLMLDVQVKGVHVAESFLAAWDGHRVVIFEIDDNGGGAAIGSFQCMTSVVAMYGQNVYVIEGGKPQVRTFQGTVKQLLPFAEEEGTPYLMDIFGHNLVVGTAEGFVRVFDVSRREAKQQFHAKNLATGLNGFYSLRSIRINSSGNKISYTVKSFYSCVRCFYIRIGGGTITYAHDVVNPKLFVWDSEVDSVGYFNFSTGLSDQQEYESLSEQKRMDDGLSRELRGSIPDRHCWDCTDPRILICDSRFSSSVAQMLGGSAYVISFFVTADYGILVHDAFRKGMISERLLGVAMPYMYFTRKLEHEITDTSGEVERAITRNIIRRVSREFVGLVQSDSTTTDALLNFSFYLTVGNMDEAFKSIKLIKSESVWENMAQMCVKTQRLDVAAVCLGNMGHARGARVLRQVIRTEKQLEVQVAVLAMQLGLLDDAARLLQSCGRLDLLNRMYQSKNSWKPAIDLAHGDDRIHLKHTYYSYAGHLESVGAVDGAIENYEKSDTHRFEIPRMLFDNPMILEQYVKKKKDVYLQKWWAQYLESLGEMEAARTYYTLANDFLSVVRICCYLGDMEEAAQVANESGAEAACYHLARQYENGGEYQNAAHFFAKAHAYGSAIRLCKDHKMEDQIAHLALMSSDSDMIEAAKFYEDKAGHADKAVMLYHKAGMFGRALDLAFRTEQFSALDLIANDLDETSDARVLERCAEFFTQSQQYTQAVQLLAYAKKYNEAVQLCIQKNVPISEELVEFLTPSKEIMPNTVERNRLLEQLADLCMQQGHYHYAAKKYTQAGSKTEAMRSLLKSSDTEKIIFFANTARDKEIYVMAGNFLQTLNWKADPDLMKQIVHFYTKGGALHLLAGFYDACAQVEIDDYRDYEKAQSALQESNKCLSKANTKDALQLQEKQEVISRKIGLIRKFLNIRSIYDADPAEAMSQLQALANEPNVNEAVRLGDIYAVLIIHNVKKENYKKAHTYLEDLRKKLPKTNLNRYIKPQIIETVYTELNLPLPKSVQDQDTDDIVPESVTLRRKIDQNKNDILVN